MADAEGTHLRQRERQPGGPALGRTPAPGKAARAEASGAATQQTVTAVQRRVGDSLLSEALSAAQEAAALEEEAAPKEPSLVHEVPRRPGRPLDSSVRGDLEPRMGWGFSRVRVHDDEIARRSADELGAEARTSGPDVVVGRGGMNRRRWAHEPGHVMQQEMGRVEGTDRGDGVGVSDASMSRVTPLPQGISTRVNAHHTTQENAEAVHRGGLRPSRGRGGRGPAVGPDDPAYGAPGRNRHHASTPAPARGVERDQRRRRHGRRLGCPQGVRRHQGHRDHYYPDQNHSEYRDRNTGSISAYYAQGGTVPARHADRAGGNSISFLLPLVPGRTLDAVTRLVNRRLPPHQRVTPAQARRMIHAHLPREHGIEMAEHLA